MAVKLFPVYIFLLTLGILCTPRAGAPDTIPSPRPDSAYITVRNHRTEGLAISVTNDYADENTYYFQGRMTVGVPMARLRFVNLTGAGTSLQIPCFPGDTTYYDFDAPGFRFRVGNHALKAYDTTFFARALTWDQRYYTTADSLSRLLKGNKPSLLQVVDKSIPGFARINQDIFENDSALIYTQLYQLDSLFRDGGLSGDFHTSYQSHLAAMFIDMALTRFNFTGDKAYLDKVPPSFVTDEHLAYDATGLYKNTVRHFIDNRIGRNNYHRYSSHEITLDYTVVYDSCACYLSSRLLDLARYICLTKIRHYNNPRTLEIYMRKWEEQTTDTAFRSYASLHFRPEQINSDGDGLVTYDHKKLTLDQLLKKFPGRKVYIDLWASWCLPCINAIQGSRQRISMVDSARAVVLYLSLDQDHDAWLQASSRLGLTPPPGKFSYRMANPRASRFLQQLKLKTIPRYVVLDKNGKIMIADAPAPDSKGFTGLLE